LNPAPKQRFSARRANFDAVRNFIETACESLRPAHRLRIILIVEELFCNSIEHGYGHDSEQPVWLTIDPATQDCRVIYEDLAHPYDPFAAPPSAILDGDAATRPLGGLGVFLVRQYCSETRYERRGDLNVIELSVPHWPPAPEGDPA
jgi:hypothetical protein